MYDKRIIKCDAPFPNSPYLGSKYYNPIKVNLKHQIIPTKKKNSSKDTKITLALKDMKIKLPSKIPNFVIGHDVYKDIQYLPKITNFKNQIIDRANTPFNTKTFYESKPDECGFRRM